MFPVFAPIPDETETTMPFEYLNDSLRCQAIQNSSMQMTPVVGISPSIEMYEAVIIILVTGFLAFVIASLFSFMRRNVYKDEDNLDTAFDAGGNVNTGLTATTVVSQWTWAATLLQSSAVAAKYGISGSLWYAAGASIQILLFSMLTVQLKTRAPGAKTFLQVIRARFGKVTHLVFCCFALATNVIVTAMLMLGGSAVITSIVKLISVEYATTLVATVIGGYTFFGGLGATFYVSFFNTAIIYVVMIILIFKVYEDDGDPSNPLGNIDRVFNFLSCAKGPSGNKGFSFLTIVSDQGVMFGLINIVGNFGTVFVDQAYWQSAVAAKPKQGVIGFILGGLAWFAVPFSLSTAMGLGYVALSAEQGQGLLSGADVDAGLVPPAVAYRLLGRSGAILIMVMVLMAVTSTGAAEIMAVTSIVVYDIYALYLKPYRLTNDTNSCILCGKGRGRMANPRDKCVCISMTHCRDCHQDTKNRAESRRAIKPDYKCSLHGGYRVYNDYLRHLKSWCLVWTTLAIIPLTLCLYMIKVSLGWVYLFMGILVGSAVVPITLTMFWERLTGKGMISGSLCGTVLALSVWLGVASSFDGGLQDWWNNTGEEMAMLCGNLVAIVGGGVITVIVSFVTNRHYDSSQGEEIWENTRDIDNPLSPWMEKYQKELNLSASHRLDNRASLQDVQKAFKRAYLLAYSLSISFCIIIVLIWPTSMVSVGVMSLGQFEGWVRVSEVWAFVAMVGMMTLPLINEIWDIWSFVTAKNKISSHDDFVEASPSNAPRKKSVQTFSGPKKGGDAKESTLAGTIAMDENNLSNSSQSHTITTSAGGSMEQNGSPDNHENKLGQNGPSSTFSKPENTVLAISDGELVTDRTSNANSPHNASFELSENNSDKGKHLLKDRPLTLMNSASAETSSFHSESSPRFIKTVMTGGLISRQSDALGKVDKAFSDVISPQRERQSSSPRLQSHDKLYDFTPETTDIDEPLF